MNLDTLAPPISFHQLTGLEYQHCMLIGKRARFLGEQIRARYPGDKLLEVHPDLVAMDIAVVHLRRGLDLKAFLESDNLSFLQEYRSIQLHINRDCRFFPADVPLLYATDSRRVTTH
jgi:hypothetical protein